jgi:hypothetical protein
MTLFQAHPLAWLGDLFEPEYGSKANGIVNLMGGLGGQLLEYIGSSPRERLSATH